MDPWTFLQVQKSKKSYLFFNLSCITHLILKIDPGGVSPFILPIEEKHGQIFVFLNNRKGNDSLDVFTRTISFQIA